MSDENPYQSPQTEADPPPKKQNIAGGCRGAFSGCLLGGIVIPIVFVLFCSLFLGDVGGIGFWIILAIASAFVGTMIGFLLGTTTKPEKQDLPDP